MSDDTSWVGSMPQTYDQALGPTLFAPYALELGRRARALAPHHVLELAAGSGVVTRELVRQLPDAEITATDLNPAMVGWAAERVPGPTWRAADAQALDLPDATVDLLVCSFGVMFFPDRPAAFAEAARVLAPGGSYLFTVWDGVEHSPLTLALVESLAVVLPQDPPSFVVRVPHGYGDPARIERDLTGGGLTGSVERLSPTGHSSSAALLAEGFCQGTPLRFELAKRGDLDALTRAVAEQMTLRLGDGPVSAELGAYLVTARV